MTRTELQRLLAAAVTAGRITAEQAATVLASFDAGTLQLADAAAVEAVIAGLAPKKRKPSGGAYIYDPATRRYTTPSEPAPRPEPERPTRPARPPKPKPLAGRIIARVKQYAQAARGTYETVRGRVAELAGYTEEMRVLHGSDHCSASELPGCIEVSRRGWVPIGTLPRIGACTCRKNCHCSFRFRRTA